VGSVVGATIAKFLICLAVYSWWPSLVLHSDARNYYLPQTLDFLSGKIPNRDFVSSYSILFTPLLAVPVKLWSSPGSIVLTMLLAETGMLIVYLRRCAKRSDSNLGWRAAFLYTLSPFSFYWVGISGHNGVLIAFWMMASLVLAEGGKAVAAGIAGAFGFLTTKVLAILAWPGLVFFDRKWVKRVLPLTVTIVGVVGLMAVGVDSLAPIRREFGSVTTGNLWFLLGEVIPGLGGARMWPYVPMVAFGVLFAVMFLLYWKRGGSAIGFDRATAFVAATNLLFLIVSKKAFSFYLVMTLIFVTHTLVRDERRLLRNLLPLAFLGSVGFVEEIHSTDRLSLVVLEILRIAAYAWCLVVCCQVFVGERSQRVAGRVGRTSGVGGVPRSRSHLRGLQGKH
jgi:hypothetical protein